jgi:mono/diheme cytochrome c family protein
MRRVLCGAMWVGLLTAAGAAGMGCSETPSPTTATVNKPASMMASGNSCERKTPGVGAARFSTLRQGGAVVLATHAAGGKTSTFAYVADEDSRAIHTVDVDKKEEVAKTTLPGAPAQVLVLADGRVAATLKNTNELIVLEPTADPAKPLVELCKREVPAEPFGLAASNDDSNILVTSGWGKALTSLNEKTLELTFAVDLPREPRSVVVDDSGERAFVSHAVGAKLSVVDLTGKHEVRAVELGVERSSPVASRLPNDRLRGGSQGYALAKSVSEADQEAIGEKPPLVGKGLPVPAKPSPIAPMPKGRIFVPMVTVEPGDPNVRSQAYYGDSRDGLPKEAPIVSVIDSGAERSMTKAVMSLGTPLTEECILPRAAAVRGSTGTMFVTCLGVDTLVELDTRGSDPARLERRRWKMPAGPTGLAMDDKGARAVVWSQFDAQLSIVDLKDSAIETIALSYDPAPEVAEIARGRRIFHTTDDLRISNDGVACASCHPEGRDDAFTWSTPEGPRQTIMLAGRSVETAPYGWQGKHGDLKSYLGNTFSRLGGSGVQGGELESLIKYLEKMPAPKKQELATVADISGGKDLFMDAQLGCAGCHVAGAGVDKTTHNVGSKAVADLDTKFDTPSLMFIKGTAPYFHDGRYKSLEEMLSSTDSEMGHTQHLTARQRQQLAAFLGSL